MKKDGEITETPPADADAANAEAKVAEAKADAEVPSVPPASDADGRDDDGDGDGDEDDADEPPKSSASAERVAKARAVAKEERGEHKSLPPPPKKLLRTAYWGVWFVLTPFALACILVWALTPPSGIDHGGALGWIESWVREQPVPVGIVTFTLFEMALWTVRHHLPLAYHAHPPLRSDLPKGLRGPFERARSLLEEAESILEKHRDAIKRDLSPKEREKLRADLDALEDAMEREPFDEEGFVDALVKADGEVDVRLGRWRKSEVREYAESILVAIAVAMALRAFVVEAFKIPSGSMIPTLQVGDHIFVNKFTYGPAIPYTHKRLW
ncbi:MAG: signal peptidase, partial [Myxococcales bacterium]|nr:signal peptidase [Myxococcales bacterium]